jgi:serine/threonine-protein kinase
VIISKDDKQFLTIPDKIETSQNVYIIECKLGVGGNAAVYECVDRQGNTKAIKFMLNLSEKARRRFSQEIKLLQSLNHPHIIKYFDNGEVSEINKGKTIPFLIMEKADTNIVDYMRTLELERHIGYEVYAPQIRGLADALSHLHAVAVHRDIKPENILVRGETWLLSDFGLCTAIDEEERIDVTKSQERIGPKYWLSPEATDKVYFGTKDINEASDVYQLCAVFWFIITKRYPLGIIERNDYALFDYQVCDELIKALKYNRDKRIPNGAALYESICNATINRNDLFGEKRK